MHQLYVDQLPVQGDLLSLSGDEGHYLGRSLRARPGETFRLAAQDGSAAKAVLEGFEGGAALLRVGPPDPDPEPGLRLWLELCAPKGDALDQALEMAVQLGVEQVRLLRSERTLAVLDQGALKAERLERRLREAARQCLRAKVPLLAPSQTLGKAAVEEGPALRLLMSERGGEALASLFVPSASGPSPLAPSQNGPTGKDPSADGTPLPVRVLVGPEGGFTSAEIALCQGAGWRSISLGPRPLKTATAVAAALAGLCALRGQAQVAENPLNSPVMGGAA